MRIHPVYFNLFEKRLVDFNWKYNIKVHLDYVADGFKIMLKR